MQTNTTTVYTTFGTDAQGCFEQVDCPFCGKNNKAYYDPMRPMAPEQACKHYVTVDAAGGTMMFTWAIEPEAAQDVYEMLLYAPVGEKVAGKPEMAAEVETILTGLGWPFELHTDGQFYWLKKEA